MSDPVIKSAKRPSSRPASARASAKTSAKSRKPSAKPSRPEPAVKRAATKAKAPARKAAPAKAAPVSKSAKSARPATKPSKSAKPRAAAPAKSAATKPAASKARPHKASTPARTAQTAKARPAARPAAKQIPAKAPTRPAPQPAPPRQPTRDEAAALKAFERAHKVFARGNFGEARMLFRSLIEQHAGASEVTARARTYLAIAEARLRHQSALPRDAESLYDRGVIELNRGDYVAAQEMFERALKREPEAADVHYALAATRARLGSIEMALQSLERALQLKPVLRVRVQHDPDLSALRNEPEYERLLFPPPRP